MKSPRFWLLVWGGIGMAVMAFVLIAASLKPGERDNVKLITGEMADFTLAFPPRPAPQIPFEAEGGMRTLDDFRGKVVLVNFWATWCAPCLKEMPSLDTLQGQLGGDDFAVVAIATDPKGREEAARYLARLETNNLALYTDPRLLFASAIGGTDGLPISILYDRDGSEIGRLVGAADWSSPEAIRLIRAVMGGDAVR